MRSVAELTLACALMVKADINPRSLEATNRGVVLVRVQPQARMLPDRYRRFTLSDPADLLQVVQKLGQLFGISIVCKEAATPTKAIKWCGMMSVTGQVVRTFAEDLQYKVAVLKVIDWLLDQRKLSLDISSDKHSMHPSPEGEIKATGDNNG